MLQTNKKVDEKTPRNQPTFVQHLTPRGSKSIPEAALEGVEGHLGPKRQRNLEKLVRGPFPDLELEDKVYNKY